MNSTPDSTTRLNRWTWTALAFNILVIIWGAYVRASGSGAGCGSHWPLCNGAIIPVVRGATAIEFAHRVTSGFCLVLAIWIAYLGRRSFEKGNRIRTAALSVLGFTVAEALLGAALVLLGYVEFDRSLGRAISIALHLSNTFALLGSLTLTAWWTTPPEAIQLPPVILPEVKNREQKEAQLQRLMRVSLVFTFILALTGALTALGDTLFKAPSLIEGMRYDLQSQSHFLVKVRVFHPFFAIAAGAIVFFLADLSSNLRSSGVIQKLSTGLKAIVALQLCVGGVNLILMAPTALQLIHLGLATLLWVVLLLLVTAIHQDTA